MGDSIISFASRSETGAQFARHSDVKTELLLSPGLFGSLFLMRLSERRIPLDLRCVVQHHLVL